MWKMKTFVNTSAIKTLKKISGLQGSPIITIRKNQFRALRLLKLGKMVD